MHISYIIIRLFLYFQQAKKILQEEIDRYIREQIDKAGEAINIAMQNKICDGDNILIYGR